MSLIRIISLLSCYNPTIILLLYTIILPIILPIIRYYTFPPYYPTIIFTIISLLFYYYTLLDTIISLVLYLLLYLLYAIIRFHPIIRYYLSYYTLLYEMQTIILIISFFRRQLFLYIFSRIEGCSNEKWPSILYETYLSFGISRNANYMDWSEPK